MVFEPAATALVTTGPPDSTSLNPAGRKDAKSTYNDRTPSKRARPTGTELVFCPPLTTTTVIQPQKPASKPTGSPSDQHYMLNLSYRRTLSNQRARKAASMTPLTY